MAPAHDGMGHLASLVYLPFGSTALWLPCYAAFSALPFHLELVKAGLVTTVLLACSPAMCAGSAGLLGGYAALHAALRCVWRRLGPAAARILSPPSVLAAGAACVQVAAAEQRASAATTPASARLCVQYQTVLVLAVFLATTWWVHRTQRRMRARFLWRTAAGTDGTGPGAHLAAAAVAEMVGPQPDSALDFLCLGVPAALCVLFAVSLSW